MYEHVLEIDREVLWIYGTITCAMYPLDHIDTITSNGDVDTNSAMYHVLYGVSTDDLHSGINGDFERISTLV